MVNGSRYYRASAWKRQHIASSALWLYPALLRFTHVRSESINADSLNSNFLQLGRSGGRPQRTVYFTLGGYLSTRVAASTRVLEYYSSSKLLE